MDTLSTWWNALAPLTQWFYAGAVFFSVLFGWQFIAALVGLSAGDSDVDAGAGADHDVSGDEAHDAAHDHGHHESVSVFKLLSLRSILAFATLFSWAGALYLDTNVEPGWAIFYAALWGLLALVLVAVMLNLLPRLAHSGNLDMRSTLGASGTVYLDIPGTGEGEIRILVSGVMTHVRAVGSGDLPIKAGASVRVIELKSPNIVVVEPVEALESGKEPPR